MDTYNSLLVNGRSGCNEPLAKLHKWRRLSRCMVAMLKACMVDIEQSVKFQCVQVNCDKVH